MIPPICKLEISVSHSSKSASQILDAIKSRSMVNQSLTKWNVIVGLASINTGGWWNEEDVKQWDDTGEAFIQFHSLIFFCPMNILQVWKAIGNFLTPWCFSHFLFEHLYDEHKYITIKLKKKIG